MGELPQYSEEEATAFLPKSDPSGEVDEKVGGVVKRIQTKTIFFEGTLYVAGETLFRFDCSQKTPKSCKALQKFSHVCSAVRPADSHLPQENIICGKLYPTEQGIAVQPIAAAIPSPS